MPQTQVVFGRVCLFVVSIMCQRLGRRLGPTPQWAKDQLLDQIDSWSSTAAALEVPLRDEHPKAPCMNMNKYAEDTERHELPTEQPAPRPEPLAHSGNKIPGNYAVAHSVIADSTSGAPLLPPQTPVGDASFTIAERTSLAILPLAQTPPPPQTLPPPQATLPPQLPSDEDYMIMQFHDEWNEDRPFCILCNKYWAWGETADAGFFGSHRASTKHRRRMQDPEWYIANSVLFNHEALIFASMAS